MSVKWLAGFGITLVALAGRLIRDD